MWRALSGHPMSWNFRRGPGTQPGTHSGASFYTPAKEEQCKVSPQIVTVLTSLSEKKNPLGDGSLVSTSARSRSLPIGLVTAQ